MMDLRCGGASKSRTTTHLLQLLEHNLANTRISTLPPHPRSFAPSSLPRSHSMHARSPFFKIWPYAFCSWLAPRPQTQVGDCVPSACVPAAFGPASQPSIFVTGTSERRRPGRLPRTSSSLVHRQPESWRGQNPTSVQSRVDSPIAHCTFGTQLLSHSSFPRLTPHGLPRCPLTCSCASCLPLASMYVLLDALRSIAGLPLASRSVSRLPVCHLLVTLLIS